MRFMRLRLSMMLSIISNAIFKISVVSFYVGQYELLTTGLAPEKVRSSIISGLGESIIGELYQMMPNVKLFLMGNVLC